MVVTIYIYIYRQTHTHTHTHIYTYIYIFQVHDSNAGDSTSFFFNDLYRWDIFQKVSDPKGLTGLLQVDQMGIQK